MQDHNLLFTGEDLKDNWFYNRYYYSGSNGRYVTFQACLNILNQKKVAPTIIETGCQRLEEDLGGGMSTSVFAEYIHRYGGKLISVDITAANLTLAANCVQQWPNADCSFVHSDSVAFLAKYEGPCDMLYLDSFDYPYGQLLNYYGGTTDVVAAIEQVSSMKRNEILCKHGDIIDACQVHCLHEFMAIEPRLSDDCILLIDDNQLAGGGKPRVLKEYLAKSKDWCCILDLQGSLWLRSL